MFSGLLIILVPLIVGYLIPLRQQAALKVINQLLSWMVYLILFFMGISLAFLDNLASNLLAILHYSAVSITVILLCNIAALMWLERGLAQPPSARKTPVAYCDGAGVAKTVRRSSDWFCHWSEWTGFLTTRDRSQ